MSRADATPSSSSRLAPRARATCEIAPGPLLADGASFATQEDAPVTRANERQRRRSAAARRRRRDARDDDDGSNDDDDEDAIKSSGDGRFRFKLSLIHI